MSIFWPNGVGGALGDSLAVARPLQVSGTVWYLDSVTGSDSFTGKERERPFATLNAAITAAASDDIIVVLGTHSQTLTAVTTISKRLILLGEGNSGGIPTASFKISSTTDPLFTLATTNIELRNLKFSASTVVASESRIQISAAMCRIVGCYFECSGADAQGAILLNAGADKARIVNTTFISTATSGTSVPGSAIFSGAAITDLEIVGCVFNGGAHGFGTNSAINFTSGAITRLKGEGISLLFGADARLNASTTGWFNVGTASGGGRVEW